MSGQRGGQQASKTPFPAGRVGHRPALVLVVPEPEAGHRRVARGAGHGEAADPVEHPAAQAHRLQQQHAGVAAGGQLRGGPGQRILPGERERKRVIDPGQPAEPGQRGDRAAVDAVIQRVPVLDQEAQNRDQVPGDAGRRDDQQRPGDVHAPGAVALQVRLGGRQVEPPAVQLPHPPAVAPGHQLGRHLLGGRVHQRAGVAGREQVHARVVGDEQFGGVEPGRRRERAPRGRAG